MQTPRFNNCNFESFTEQSSSTAATQMFGGLYEVEVNKTV